MAKKSQQDYYRVTMDNGKISILLFDKDNPVPHTKIKGRLKDKHVREAIENLKKKYGGAFVSDFSDLIDIGTNFNKKFEQDVGEYLR